MLSTDAITVYVNDIVEQFNSGHAREHAYRPALKTLLSSFEDVIAVNDPKRSDFGNPDFVFLKASNRAIIRGYAEAKDITVELDKTIKTEQLRRYAGYEKLFLTNGLDFRFFRNGELYQTVMIGKISNGRILFDHTAFGRLHDEIQAFLELPPEQIKSGKKLALIMGGKARRIRDNVAAYLGNTENEKNQELEKIYDLMRELLVHDLSTEKFADMYAQTLVYGLFVARYNDKTPESFDRSEARDLVPKSNPFLRHFFDHIVGPDFDMRLTYIVDELCEVFSVSDVYLLVQKHLRLFEVENEKDPIIHFYEDFLKEYDPEERKRMGAYYTPIPVVRFIVRQVDKILKRDFGLVKGLADDSKIMHEVEVGQDMRHDRRKRLDTKQKFEFHRVQVLDPAVGTATFLNETIKHIAKSFEGQEGMWPSYVEESLLDRLHGFELMMAPYTIAHLKLGMTLQESGVEEFNKRLGVYLTNTLEEGIPRQLDLLTSFGLAGAVTEESRLASEIKHDRPIMVVMGNPPYSASSSNRTEYANGLVEKYKVEPGGKAKLNEKKHWLNDDYVKFIAFAEDMIAKNGRGVVAMITNNGYLDNSSFRGMRWHLAKTFDKIYILDLHGNAKKKEVAPDGSKDVNVFDIMQGVSIVMMVKTGDKQTEVGEVYHSELYGTRHAKFDSLSRGEPTFKQLNLYEKNWQFINKNTEGLAEYEKGINIAELLPGSVTGLVSGKDKVTMFDTHEECQSFVEWCKTASDEELEIAWGKFGRGQTAQKIRDDANDPQGVIAPVSYRPFEKKWTWYTGTACGFLFRPRRKEIMGSLIPHFSSSAEKDISFLADFSASPNISSYQNFGISFERNGRFDKNPIFVNADIIPNGYSFSNTASIVYTSPLYIYHGDGTRGVNFDQKILKELSKNLKEKYNSEDVLDYIYAVLYSPKYRAKYKEFLQTDFPRVPAPMSDGEFTRLVSLGKQLRELHLMTSPLLDGYDTTFPKVGTNEVEKLEHKENKVYINDTQYFGNVPEVVWNFYIGGYQPAQKWLKDRKGRQLSAADIDHYQKIIKILSETDKIMHQIDEPVDVE